MKLSTNITGRNYLQKFIKNVKIDGLGFMTSD